MTAEESSFPHGLGAEPPRPMHSYTVVGPNQLAILKRSDLREVVQVGVILFIDPAIGAKEITEKVCAIFDEELVTRGAAAQKGDTGHGGA